MKFFCVALLFHFNVLFAKKLETDYKEIFYHFQDGMTLLFSSGIRKYFDVIGGWFFQGPTLDMDVVRFVFEMTKNRWLYIHHVVKMWLVILDRIVDIVAITVFTLTYSNPYWAPGVWGICVSVYIVLRLISLIDFVVWCCIRKCFKCYKVRTALAIILSMICIFASAVPNISQFRHGSGVMYMVSVALGLCLMWVLLFMWVLKEIKLVEKDVVGFQIVENHWLHRYQAMRRVLFISDRFFDIFAVLCFIMFYLGSVPYWPVCLGIYIALRVVSLVLCCNTKLWKCYAIRTVLPAILSVFCVALVMTPVTLSHRSPLAAAIVAILVATTFYITQLYRVIKGK